MNKLINGSICYTDLVAKMKEGHSSGSRASNGKVYVNIAIWLNEEPDKFGNHASIQLNSTKEKRDEEGKVYIGNGKIFERSQPEPVAQGEIGDEDDDLPF